MLPRQAKNILLLKNDYPPFFSVIITWDGLASLRGKSCQKFQAEGAGMRTFWSREDAAGDLPSLHGHRSHIFSLHTELMCCSASLCAFVSLSLPLWCRQGIWVQLHLLCLSTESQWCHPTGKPVSCEHSIALLGITQSDEVMRHHTEVSTTGSEQPGLAWGRLSASTVQPAGDNQPFCEVRIMR